MILHDLGAIYCLVMNFFRSCPTTEMTSVDRVIVNDETYALDMLDTIDITVEWLANRHLEGFDKDSFVQIYSSDRTHTHLDM